MHPKLIIFDWDGTLADTTNPIVATFRQSFEDCNLPVPEAEDIRHLIGYNLPTIIRHLAPNLSLDKQAELAETYAAHYLNPNNHNMKLFDSALPCLQTLKAQGYWLAVATGKGRTGLNQAIEQTQTQEFWMATTCASEQPSKPAPDMVFTLCDELGLSPQESIVIGDTTHDLQMAAHAKALAIGITTGAHALNQLRSEPHLTILNDLSELPVFLQDMVSV